MPTVVCIGSGAEDTGHYALAVGYMTTHSGTEAIEKGNETALVRSID